MRATNRINNLILFLVLVGIISSCSIPEQKQPPSSQLPNPEREFRAAWIATVANINWPSRRNLTTEEQKNEAIKLLDLLVEHNFNAAVFQARPQCDALYESSLEPWSYYLTGKQGTPPEPYYDPLQFWIKEAHKRGLELHVWVNPYRAHHKSGGPIGDNSIVKTNPEIVHKLESGYYWMDPASEATQQHSHNVIMDIVNRYDVDGIHMDDYFYPYPSYNGGKDFPDSLLYKNFIEDGGELSRADWRRNSVNNFIKLLYADIKSVKPYVKFGLSPFGIWRPNFPPSIKGFDQHEVLYADAKKWLNEGWIDYWTPQLYWTISDIDQSYPVLLGWWKDENKLNRHFWPGINVNVSNKEGGVKEVLNQIMVTRGMLPESMGNVHWSIAPLVNNPDYRKMLVKGPYKKKALIPSSPWLNNVIPPAPVVNFGIENDENISITWETVSKDIRNIVLYQKFGNKWDYNIIPAVNKTLKLSVYKDSSQTNKLSAAGIVLVSKAGNTSPATIINF